MLVTNLFAFTFLSLILELTIRAHFYKPLQKWKFELYLLLYESVILESKMNLNIYKERENKRLCFNKTFFAFI